MTNNNLGGSNQFGNYTIQPQYGDVKKETQLLKESPISGSPFAAQALGAPRRAGRLGQGGRTAPPAAAPPTLPPVNQQVQASPQAVYQQIAQIPGITPMWAGLLG